jgi:uncharacterized protein YbjT (DUF2867 family)
MAAKQITVFGASGFIGRYVVKRLAARGYLVRAAVRDPARAIFLKPMGDVGQITPVQANIRNPESVAAAIDGAHGVVDLVGILYERGKQKFDAVHRVGAETIAKAAKQAGAKSMVYLSALGASEKSSSQYARSKAVGEAVVRQAFEDAVVLRPSVVFGPQDDFFNRFAEMACLLPALPVVGCSMPNFRNGKLDCYGDGGAKFQPVYVGDVADAVVMALESDALAGKSYELGGPRIYSFKEIMELILTETGRERLLVPVPFWLASFAAFFAEFLPVPPITRDQVALLRSENVVSEGSMTLGDLGIEATAVEAILPSYLDQYCKGGRFSRFSQKSVG